VRFDLRNVGSRRGIDVPQVYVGRSAHPPVPLVVRRLAAFARVAPAPAGRTRVTLNVTPRELSYWSTARHRWVLAGGRRAVYVAESSRDLRLRTTVRVR